MINLKLAEYKEGKFEKYLELGKDFLYGGDFIIFTKESGYFFIDNTLNKYREKFKDKKDPLGRFNGLFDDRTYGEGRFVLIQGFEYKKFTHWQDSIYSIEEVYGRKRALDILSFLKSSGNYYGEYPNAFDFSYSKDNCDSGAIYLLEEYDGQLVGNIHENPELWEKIK